MAFKVFLDTNIFIDHLQERDKNSIEIIRYCELEKVEGYASSSSFYTIAYLTEKYSGTNARSVIERYANLVKLVPTNSENIFASLSSSFRDLEDSFQYFTALNVHDINFFITNNTKDFKGAFQKFPVITPVNFIKMISQE
jgi:predicted nucleic acid-binding protein